MIFKKQLVETRELIFKIRNEIFGDKKYNKFIIITRSRTGSNFLMSLLNSHPNILAKGELFRRLEGKSSDQVWNETFSKKPKHIKYVGFKIFYYHPLDSEDKEVWNYIKKDKNIKIIHLTRNNILRTVVSRAIADKTNTWTNKKGKKIDISDKRVKIDIDSCLNDFKKTREDENRIRDNYKNRNLMELTYEDLVKDHQKVMNDVFNFLEIEINEVNSDYKKQNNEKLEDLITNYNDVVEAIKKSKWSYILDLDR